MHPSSCPPANKPSSVQGLIIHQLTKRTRGDGIQPAVQQVPHRMQRTAREHRVFSVISVFLRATTRWA